MWFIHTRLPIVWLLIGVGLVLIGAGCSRAPEAVSRQSANQVTNSPKISSPTLAQNERLTTPPLPEQEVPKPGGENSSQVIEESTTGSGGAGGSVPAVTASTHAIVVLPVPFTPQAPFAVWDELHREACEEASILMVGEYFSGRRDLRLPPDEADKSIRELVQWEEERDYAIDVTAAEVASILRDRFGLTAEVVAYDPQRLRSELAAQRPVILPAAGRLLGNPYFRRPGPLYHMLVVKGYEGDEFIVNDPGTRRGESYRYHESVFARAVHDWNGGDVEHGEQVMVIVSKSGV